MTEKSVIHIAAGTLIGQTQRSRTLLKREVCACDDANLCVTFRSHANQALCSAGFALWRDEEKNKGS